MTVHVDDLFISSVNTKIINDLCDVLKEGYGDITRHDDPVLNYLGMVFDMSINGEAKVTMRGYFKDLLKCSNTP